MSVPMSLAGTPRRREKGGRLPADADASLAPEPVSQSGVGSISWVALLP
jgi:hypothetical protein